MRQVFRPFRAALLCAALAVGLSACEAEEDVAEPTPPPAPSPTVSPLDEGLILNAVGFDALPGWTEDDLSGARQAFERSCNRLLAASAEARVGSPALATQAVDWQPACAALQAVSDDTESLRAFFEANFEPFQVRDAADGDAEDADQGLFTGYFEAELSGSRVQDETYATPLYTRPDDLVTVDLGLFNEELRGKGVVGIVENGRLKPYPTRGDIESGALDGKGLEMLWIDDAVDAFLLQVQGSGRVILPDGEVVRVGFAAHNGHGYRSIGRRLIDLGELKAHQASWTGIRNWISNNPNKARDLFAFNPRFIFFRLLTGEGPIGAEGVALTPERSLAVDTQYIPLGMPLWLDTVRPGSDPIPMRRLMVAQDKGGAIKGVVRGDFFWGYGDAALAEAGRMKSRGRYFLLLPKPLAERVKAVG